MTRIIFLKEENKKIRNLAVKKKSYSHINVDNLIEMWIKWLDEAIF